MRALLASSKQSRPKKLLLPRNHALLYSIPSFLKLSVDSVIHVGAICNMTGRRVGISVPARYPTTGKSQRIKHTEISVSYKADWPIRSVFLLVLVTYINPLFWFILVSWLSTFFSWQITSCFLSDLRRTGSNQLLPPQNSPTLLASFLLPVWFFQNRRLLGRRKLIPRIPAQITEKAGCDLPAEKGTEPGG